MTADVFVQGSVSRKRRGVGADRHQTPGFCTRALLAHEQLSGSIWEPACGQGQIVEELLKAGYSDFFASDLLDGSWSDTGYDFLTHEMPGPIHTIVTNPPYSLAEPFVRRACEVAQRKVCLFMRLLFLESSRGVTLFSQTGLTRVYVLTQRVNFRDQKLGGMMAFAWFVWDKAVPWQGRVETRFINPGDYL